MILSHNADASVSSVHDFRRRLELEIDEGYRLGPRKQGNGHERQGRAQYLSKHSPGDQPALKPSAPVDRDPKKDRRKQDGEAERKMQRHGTVRRHQVVYYADRLSEAPGPKGNPAGAHE